VNNYKGYSLFNDISDKTLQTWNRVVVLFNITLGKGKEEGTAYLKHFSRAEMIDIKTMYLEIKSKGMNAVRSTLNA